jgi:membrane-associated phospholipid phosphatase
MSLLSEASFTTVSSRLATAHQSRATQVVLDAVSMQTGQYGELKLVGANLLTTTPDDRTFLKLNMNDTHCVAELYPWVPTASRGLTFARNVYLQSLQSVLDAIAAVESGPLTTSRTLYLFAMSMAMAWMQVTPQSKQGVPAVRGVKDTWNFDVSFSTGSRPLSQDDASVWMVHAITQIMPNFLHDYDASAVLDAQRQFFQWSEDAQAAEVQRVCTQAGWEPFYAAYNTWWSYRQADGFNDPLGGAYVATAADLVNIETPLVVADSAMPPTNQEWTPLTLPTTPPQTQAYLGWRWAQVHTTCLAGEDMSGLLAVAAAFFPTEPERAAEVAEVRDITASLTDQEKLSAEFWAGGSFTYTPPGQFAWLWKDLMARLLGTALSTDSTAADMGTQVLSFLELAVALFEGSRVVWHVKSTFKQSRPIQEIRWRYFDVFINTWSSPTPIAGQDWVPYQVNSFVTPPFADFSSGHSYFSQAFALCMTRWFGESIPALPPADLAKSELLHMAPLFAHAPETLTDVQYATFIIPPGSSEIQPDVVPAATTTLSYSTWAQLATDVGMSRLYGGIHCITAHTASAALADALYPLLQTKWQIEKA